ncbi:hypothetical protein M514_04971, partial [Trichuris suis]
LQITFPTCRASLQKGIHQQSKFIYLSCFATACLCRSYSVRHCLFTLWSTNGHLRMQTNALEFQSTIYLVLKLVNLTQCQHASRKATICSFHSTNADITRSVHEPCDTSSTRSGSRTSQLPAFRQPILPTMLA